MGTEEKVTETRGRDRLLAWLAGKSKEQTLSRLAERMGLKVPTVHGWKTGKWRPTAENRPLLCAIIGGKPSEWDTESDRKARTARGKLLKSLSGGRAA